jgi:DNA-binding response OmpR family regulator
MPSVLVVEDEIRIARLVKDYLHEAGFAVLTARTGKAGLALVRSEKPDLVILDIGLPEMDGYDVTRSMRATSTTPIIMLTARNAETDRIVGLELGADDYVVKPFSPRELVARVKAVLRRTSGGMPVEVIRARDLVIDLSRRTVSRDGTTIDLTTSEFELLRFMATQPGDRWAGALHRCPHQEHEAQAGARTREASLHHNGLRSGIQVRGCLKDHLIGVAIGWGLREGGDRGGTCFAGSSASSSS